MFKRLLVYIIALALSFGCTKNEPVPVNAQFPFNDNGFFIVNEGNFSWGNGSLDYYSFDSLKLYNGVFSNIAGKAPGDIPLRITKHGNRLYIVINNSGRIEVLDLAKQAHSSTIHGLISPRDIKIINDERAIVSSLYSDSLAIIDISTSTITAYIDIGKSSECILVNDENVFISNWSGNSSITVLRKSDLAFIKSIETAPEPSEMVVDKDGMIWVICSGGYLNEEYPELISIDPLSLEITKTLRFGVRECNPSELVINSSGDTLYYINGDIFSMPYNASELPSMPLIEAGEKNFYRLGFEKTRNTIIATDALDYIQKGYFYIYTPNGIEIAKCKAGIIPGKINN